MSSRFAPRSVGLVCLVLVMAPAWAAEETASSKAVPFVFGWKPGLKIGVEHKSSREMPGKSQRGTLRYTLSVDAAGENLAVRFKNPKIGGPTLAPNAGAQAFQEQLSVAALPELLVKTSGDYVGLVDPDGQSTRVLTLLQKIVAEKVPGPAQIGVNNSLVMFASPQYLESKAGDLWNPIVGFWLESKPEVGETYEFELMSPVPIIPGALVKQKGQFSVVETHTCLRAGIERTCAGIQMHVETDPEDVARLLKQVLERMNTTGRTLPKFDALSVKWELTLVTEPDGMFPHEYSSSREMHASMTTAGKTEKVHRIDLDEARYTY